MRMSLRGTVCCAGKTPRSPDFLGSYTRTRQLFESRKPSIHVPGSPLSLSRCRIPCTCRPGIFAKNLADDVRTRPSAVLAARLLGGIGIVARLDDRWIDSGSILAAEPWRMAAIRLRID